MARLRTTYAYTEAVSESQDVKCRKSGLCFELNGRITFEILDSAGNKLKEANVKQNLLVWCMAMECLCSMIPSARGQALFGSVVGNVQDSNGAAVAGTVVTLSNIETRQERQATTTDTG